MKNENYVVGSGGYQFAVHFDRKEEQKIEMRKCGGGGGGGGGYQFAVHFDRKEK